MIDFGDFKFRCHWRDVDCENKLFCDECEFQPVDDDKPNGKKDPVKIGWEESYDGIYPKCPSCGEMPYSTERCVFCGQKFIQDGEMAEWNKEPDEERHDCFACGGKGTLVGARAHNGHFHGTCEKCGCVVME